MTYVRIAEIQHHSLLLAVRNEDNAFFSVQLFSAQNIISQLYGIQLHTVYSSYNK